MGRKVSTEVMKKKMQILSLLKMFSFLLGQPVIERGNGVYELGSNAHNHPPDVGAVSAAKITSKVKARAVADVFKPASAIVEDVLLEDFDDVPCPSLPRSENIGRAANRHRQRLRPKDPQDLEFELATDRIPSEFLRADLRVRSRRHLVFAIDEQLEFLAHAKSWYINATFKLCRRPFSQLMMVNAFIRKDDHVKQVPLLFMLMSGRKKSDYCKVFEELIEILPSVPKVQQITLDFEKATWAALRKVLTHANLHGCVSLDASPLEKGKINLIQYSCAQLYRVIVE